MRRLVTSIAALSMVAGTLTVGSLAVAMPAAAQDYSDAHPADVDGRGWHIRSDIRRGGFITYQDWKTASHIDYIVHGLSSPRRGYEWREIDHKYVMASTVNGAISSVILNPR